jgi:transposase-like protein
VPRRDLRKGVADIRATFNAPDAEDAKRLLKRFITKYQASALKQATWTAEAPPPRLHDLRFTAAHRGHR